MIQNGNCPTEPGLIVSLAYHNKKMINFSEMYISCCAHALKLNQNILQKAFRPAEKEGILQKKHGSYHYLDNHCYLLPKAFNEEQSPDCACKVGQVNLHNKRRCVIYASTNH